MGIDEWGKGVGGPGCDCESVKSRQLKMSCGQQKSEAETHLELNQAHLLVL